MKNATVLLGEERKSLFGKPLTGFDAPKTLHNHNANALEPVLASEPPT